MTKSANLLFIVFALTLTSLSAWTQNSFQYQAVIRDSTGAPIANQAIGAEISIIMGQASNPADYVESHTAQTNDFGVVNLHVGEGLSSSGDFSELDWSQVSFIEVGIDATGGTDYELLSSAEILSVPRALYALNAGHTTGQSFGLLVTDFGATGDGITDDTPAFEAAIDSAAVSGASIFVPRGIYQITSTLEIPDGVRLIGEGTGSTPLQTPYNGSLLRYAGSGFAIEIKGHSSGLENLAVANYVVGSDANGILVKADNRLVESVFCASVLISNFTLGTGLKLEAVNSGGLPYGVYQNIRVRNAKTGYHLRQDGSSFVNSNGFYDGVISGGGFDYGIRIEGGNNNVFHGTVIEPPSSQIGHLVVESGEVQGEQVRIEGTAQDAAVPLIEFAAGTSNSTLTGTYAGGLTLDKGNNFINMRSGKAIHYRNSSNNLFVNATFASLDGLKPTGWTVSGSGAVCTMQAPELTPGHQVLKVILLAGKTATVEPASGNMPAVGDLPLYEQVNYGFHIKTTAQNAAYTATNAPAGWAASQAHSGSGKWEFVGMNAFVHQTQAPKFQLHLVNTSGSQIEIYITTPTLCFGNQAPTIDPAPLTTSGGQLSGLLTHAVASGTTPANGFLLLPRTANLFTITNSTTIYRINHGGADRFPFGSVITLLFDVTGTNVTSGPYLNLKSGFTSVANASLTLMSNGNGTWREVGRNN